jgi:hypothetical protein
MSKQMLYSGKAFQRSHDEDPFMVSTLVAKMLWQITSIQLVTGSNKRVFLNINNNLASD